ncbi:MAG: helix-turn-helix transcriptional regulator [Saprospiraceae bacterium]|nr:helix-turn-helix transcriptional regulator [Saprospiraceae bacterium]
MGIPRTTLGDYERGHTEPNMELLLTLAKVYGVQIEGLLTGN